MLSVGHFQSLEEVTAENWREQQIEAEAKDPRKAGAVKDYEASMQRDTTAVISDGEESGEDYDPDHDFEDLKDSSADNECPSGAETNV